MNQEYYILIRKLRAFINKYYKNLILKGLIIATSIILTMFLVINAIEYFAWNSILIRTIIFYTFITLASFVVIFYILLPFFKLINIGKTISYQDAAKIIGKHFPDVEDKLLNTIQLQNELEHFEDNDVVNLLSAGIDQKARKLTPIPFKNAVEIRKNIQYLKYVLPPVLAVIAILIIFPAFITEPSSRIVQHDVFFSKPLPYSLQLENKDLKAFQKDDFTVTVKATGEEIPKNIFINDGKYEYRMTGPDNGFFTYTFKDLNTDIYFKLQTEDFLSQEYHLSVLPKPVIYSFDILLYYPAYLKKKTDKIENSGDLVVPEGTQIKWLIYAKDSKHIIFKIDSTETVLDQDENNVFAYNLEAKTNFWYSLFAENDYLKNSDSLSFNVQVIRDEYPSIEVNPVKQDDAEFSYLFFNGSISDDHGFHSLKFYYKKDSIVEQPWQSHDLKIDQDITKQVFNYALRTEDLNIRPGTGITYYFEVRDNDVINGYKRTKSSIYDLHVNGLEEIKSKYTNTSKQIKDKIKQALDELEIINREIEEKRESLIDKKDIDWSDKKQLSELFDQQKSLENQVKELKKLNEELNKYEDLLKEKNSEALEEKIDQLNKMFEELNTENVEKAKEELDKLDKDKINNLLQDLQEKNNDLKMDLEQNLELYKQMEVEKKMQQTIDDLKQLAENQQELAKKNAEKEIEKGNAESEQKKVGEQFKEIEKSLKEVDSLNSSLEEPYDIKTDQQKIDSINNEMDNAVDNLQKGKQKKAAKNQQQAGDQMEKMANQLSMMMQGAMMARMGEDAEKIKKMLDNLLDLSFNQENLMKQVEKTSLNDPRYVDNLGELQRIKDGYQVLHDSLIAISKRQIAVRQFIVKESDKINLHINRALLYLQDRKRGQALNDQQYSMTSMNNLALMLAESLDQMQASMQMSGQKPGQQCPNPGQGKPASLEQMIKMQQGLNQGMENGTKKNGLNGKEGLNQQSEELARLAELQSEIRRRLSEYLEELKKSQGGSGDLSKLIDEMKKTEEDIVNRKITKETLERQKQIEVRLLKSEKAKLEQEKKETRESREGVNQKRIINENTGNLSKEKEKKEDLLQTVPIEMSPYFNNLLKKYLYKLETNGS